MRTQQTGNDEDDREHAPSDEHGGDEPNRSREAHPQANRGEQLDIAASQRTRSKGEGAENQEKPEYHSVLPELCRQPPQGHCGQAGQKNSEAGDVRDAEAKSVFDSRCDKADREQCDQPRRCADNEIHLPLAASRLFAARTYQWPLAASACVKAAIARALSPRSCAATPA